MTRNPDTWPTTLAEAVNRLLAAWSEESRTKVRNTPPDRLAQYHHGLGTGIRNGFGLWKGNSELLTACGHPEMHADTASSVILQAVWNQLHGIAPENARLQNYNSEREVYRELGPEKSYLRLLQDLGREEFARDAIGHLFGLSQEQVADVVARASLLQDIPNKA